MILAALIDQFKQRFQHEKRAQVCLWFDEKEDFARLLPLLHLHFDGMKSPPFRVLEYDKSQCHGQVWLRHQIHLALNGLPEKEQRSQRFVIYLPLSEDRFEHGGSDGEPPLDMLAEYRIAGVTWRVGGKRPTLFSFLKQAGVKLPTSPSDQRRLYEGGKDSLLAKYVTKFASRPAVFWSNLLSPELAQSRLVGDLDQTILDLAVAPEATWQALHEHGLLPEFLAMVGERYGVNNPADDPVRWVENLVTVLALTETFLGYEERTDFPLADRLPALAVRPHHVELLHRWLRDSESRPAWDRWVKVAESKVDLSGWAKDKPGSCFGFPHLVRLRWQQTADAFATSAAKSSSTKAFFEEHGNLIAREAEYSKASFNPAGSWQLMRQLQEFVTASETATALAEKAATTQDFVELFVQQASVVDATHIELRRNAEEQSQPLIGSVADRSYATYTNKINNRFFERYVGDAELDIPGLPYVTSRLEERLWKAQGKRAVLIIDALRYDCAHLIRQTLQNYDVTLEPMRAAVPTVTPIGMTALMPLSEAKLSFEVKGNALHPRIDGKDAAARSTRIAFLKEFGADCREIADLESSAQAPKELGELVVVFGHEEVDHIGHGSADTLVRHIHLEVERIARLIRKLHRWNYPEVHVITDHGFILLDEDKLPDEVSCDKSWCRVKKERFALVPAEADLPVATLPFVWDSSLRVALPPGLAFFKTEKSFSHGGVALQELVIPHLVSRSHMTVEKRVGVEVVLPTFKLMRTSVKVTLRPKPAASSKDSQIALFSATGRTLSLDVLRPDSKGALVSVLPSGRPKEVHIDPKTSEQNVTLFFDSAHSFSEGEVLELHIQDVETMEEFPHGGIKLTMARDV